MATPRDVVFDRYSLLEGLNVVDTNSPLTLTIDGIGILTSWLSSGIWDTCYDAVSTSWAACYTQPVTGWSALAQPSTTWVPSTTN